MANEKQALVETLKGLLEQNVTEIKEQVETLKTQFYRLYHEEQAALKAAAEASAAEAGEVLENWQPAVDELEVEFRQLLAAYKQRRAEEAAKVAKEQEQNLLRKENIISQMKDLAAAETADVMGNVQKMRELQAEWKSIGSVPAPKQQEINKQYQQYQEQFYDLVKINIELRDLDFKKNLELKTLLCEAAEKLINNPNIVEANRALQQLHEEWQQIGPVARELREEIWARFKEASTTINKKHQAYFDALHEKEAENLTKKQALIERLKALDYSQAKNAKAWDELTQEVQAIQDEWRSIGFAPKKYNQSIYEEYRQLCAAFFSAKTAYYKSIRETFSENLKRKRALLEEALKLKEGEVEEKAAQRLRELQKEWKTIGPVAHKYSDDLWKSFTAACDAFFEKHRQAVNAAKSESQKDKGSKLLLSSNRSQLLRVYENLEKEIKTAENNILFFSGKSKSANRLVDDMQKKIEALKKQRADLEARITALDNEE